jgi:UPF0148 protein
LSQGKDDEEHVKRMADLLREGATMTDMACPACASPLFRLKDGTLWCAKDKKKVVVLKEGEEPAKVTSSMALDALEATLLAKINELQNRMQDEQNIDELQKLGAALSGLLENLEKLRKIKKT